ncbi:type IV secretory system conjugative DNA transfer family protein, partial [Xanthomonas albilineans]
SKLRKTVQSIYVGVSPAKLIEAKGVLNLFFEQAIKLNGRELPEHNPELKYQCMFMLDEFTALGRVEIVPVAVGWVAGYGIRIVIVIQSIAQLESVYGADTARGLITNLGVRIVFTPREQRDAEEYSKMLGETTVRR